MKNVLVTGGAGFIGSNFIHYLLLTDRKVKVYNLDKLTYAADKTSLFGLTDPVRHMLINEDICNFEAVKDILDSFGIDTIVHFAAETHVDRSISSPYEFMLTNVIGTYNLLESAREVWRGNSHCRFHHISTDEVFGSLETLDNCFREDTPYAPRSPYSASKAGSDHVVRAYGITYGLPVTITNCSNNYGLRQHKEKLIPTIILNAVRGKKIPIYGTGMNIRDWIHVSDHCKAVYEVLVNGEVGETYLVGGNNERHNLELARMICEQLDKIYPLKGNASYKSQIEFVADRPGHDFRYALDSSRIRNNLNWKAETDFEEGLHNTILWYLEKYPLDKTE
jgi:dTDP-glucose 4,6-dehydratase